jgi:transcription-repair coupling factor (superfamily II helicase)
MNLELLLKEYAKDPRCFQIADRITLSKMQLIHLSGLRGSATEFVLSAIFNHSATSQLNHLVILRDAEEAAYFHNTFENLTQALDIFYFPSSFKNKKNYRLLNSSHVMLRTEALTKIAGGCNKKVLITYPEALFEKVPTQKNLVKNTLRVQQGKNYSIDFINELLYSLCNFFYIVYK